MKLYYALASSPCRAVLLLIHALNLNLDLHVIKMEAGEHLTAEYIKMNPQHTVPLLVDDDLILSESRAIMAYLAEVYGNSTYYPSNPKLRAIVNQRLMFDQGTLYQRFHDAYIVPLLTGKNEVDEYHHGKMLEALGFLESFISSSKYIAGNIVTIADHAVIATVSSIQVLGNDISQYPSINSWFARSVEDMNEYYEAANGNGAKSFGEIVKHVLKLEKDEL